MVNMYRFRKTSEEDDRAACAQYSGWNESVMSNQTLAKLPLTPSPDHMVKPDPYWTT